jgi:hypothetical protein
MKKSTCVQGFLIASLVAAPLLLLGCKKKETAPAEGSAAPAGSAAPVGSADPAGSAGSAGSAAATGSAGSAAGSAAPSAGADASPASAAKITAKLQGKDEGTFEKAIYFHRGGDYMIAVAQACDKFNCGHFGTGRGDFEKLEKDCPSAKVLTMRLQLEADPKPGDVEVGVSVIGVSSGGDINGMPMKGGKLTAVSDKEIKGTVDIKKGDGEAKGTFTATVCK